MKKKWIIWGVVIVILVAIFSTFKVTYNTLVTTEEGVTAAWGQVENQYQRRSDLITNLVSTVKGYAAH